MICARCKKEWTATDGMFITCPSCRITDSKKAKRGCSRFSRTYDNKKDSSEPSSWDENNVRHLEDR